MGKNIRRVIYKPDHEKTDEFIVIVNPAEYGKWKAGDTSIPLSDVVDSFQVFHSGQGSQGILGKASFQQLDNAFGTHKDDAVVTLILQKGKEQAGDAFHAGFNATNVTRGSAVIDNKGRGHVTGGT